MALDGNRTNSANLRSRENITRAKELCQRPATQEEPVPSRHPTSVGQVQGARENYYR